MEDEIRDESFAIIILNKVAETVAEMSLRRVLLTFFKSKIFKELSEFELSEVTLDLYLACKGSGESLCSVIQMYAVLYIRLDCGIEFMQGLLMFFLESSRASRISLRLF